MKLTLGDLFASPDFHLFALEAERALFVRMDHAAYRRSIFLDARIKAADPAPIAVPLAPLLDHAATRPTTQTGWIFHVAQCGSTLLARALDRPQANLVLREPIPLRQLGVANAAARPAADPARLVLALRMVERRYREACPTIVKANVPVNFMLGALEQAHSASPAIFLYLRLEAYLLAVLRSEGHRQWVLRVTDELADALPLERTVLASLDTPRRAALLWTAQIERFHRAMGGLRQSVSLDAETLFAEPRAVIPAAAALFGAPMDDDAADALVGGELFTTYSKNPTIAFDNHARTARAAETAARLGVELRAARDWLADTGLAQRIPTVLARPLYGTAQPLLG